MLRKPLTELLLTCAILPMLVQPVLAHSIWIVRDDNQGEFNILYGHPEEEPQDYDSIKFEEAKAYDQNGISVPISIQRKYHRARIVSQGNVAAIIARHNNGYFIRTGEDEFRNVFRPEALELNTNQTEISHTYKYTKAFFGSSGLVSQRFGLPLEIIPQQDPFASGAGGTLRVQVLFKGLQQGVTVEYRGQKVSTNNNGIAFVSLGQGNLHIIESEYSIPSKHDRATDEIGYASSLTIDKGR
jgi:nickel transport protein